MGNEASKERILKLKSKTFRKTLERMSLTLEEFSSGLSKDWEITNLVLHNSILSIYSSSSLENSIELTKDIFTKFTQSQELVLIFKYDKNSTVWKFRPIEENSIIDWYDALILSKRPRFIEDSCCQSCHNSFTTFRRKHHCRGCGKILCNSCSYRKIKIFQLGYEVKKRVCDDCFENFETNLKVYEKLFEN